MYERTRCPKCHLPILRRQSLMTTNPYDYICKNCCERYAKMDDEKMIAYSTIAELRKLGLWRTKWRRYRRWKR